MLKRLMVVGFLCSLMTALPLWANEFGYSMEPSSGPSAGGTTVTIHGDFGDWPYAVIFGTTVATSTTKVDSHTLTATTPAHLPGSSVVTIFEYDTFLFTDLSFTFTGGPSESFTPILLPVFVPPIQGAFGSEFHTDLHAYNTGDVTIDVFGLKPLCLLDPNCIDDGDPLIDAPLSIGAQSALEAYGPEPNGNPGRLIYVPKSSAGSLNLSLRAYDTSRSATNFGTEEPIPTAADFRHDRFALLGVPMDPRFRVLLRLYSTDQTEESVRVTVAGTSYDVPLRPGANIFEPSYAEFSQFPKLQPIGGLSPTFSVIIDPPSTPVITPPVPPAPVWGFITVTNNDTQHITTITPQPRH